MCLLRATMLLINVAQVKLLFVCESFLQKRIVDPSITLYLRSFAFANTLIYFGLLLKHVENNKKKINCLNVAGTTHVNYVPQCGRVEQFIESFITVRGAQIYHRVCKSSLRNKRATYDRKHSTFAPLGRQ